MHFDIKIDPSYKDIKAEDLEAILANEISVEESLFFSNLTIDASSLEVKPGDDLPQVRRWNYKSKLIEDYKFVRPNAIGGLHLWHIIHGSFHGKLALRDHQSRFAKHIFEILFASF